MISALFFIYNFIQITLIHEFNNIQRNLIYDIHLFNINNNYVCIYLPNQGTKYIKVNIKKKRHVDMMLAEAQFRGLILRFRS